MKSFFILPLLVLSGFVPGKTPPFIDPTGTYRLKGVVRNNRIIGHSGELRVRLLNDSTVALCFYMNAGYPGYKAGSFIDTSAYEDNKATYQPPLDTSCAVYFNFELQKVQIMQVMSDPRSGCGFAPGVFIPTNFPKVSSEVPVIQSLTGRGN
jgi:hypothetical protein